MKISHPPRQEQHINYEKEKNMVIFFFIEFI